MNCRELGIVLVFTTGYGAAINGMDLSKLDYLPRGQFVSIVPYSLYWLQKSEIKTFMCTIKNPVATPIKVRLSMACSMEELVERIEQKGDDLPSERGFVGLLGMVGIGLAGKLALVEQKTVTGLVLSIVSASLLRFAWCGHCDLQEHLVEQCWHDSSVEIQPGDEVHKLLLLDKQELAGNKGKVVKFYIDNLLHEIPLPMQ